MQVVDVQLLSVNEARQNASYVATAKIRKKASKESIAKSDQNQSADKISNQVASPESSENLITNLQGAGGKGDHIFSYLIGLIYKHRIYPYECIRLKQQGQVAVSFYIGENGEVSDVKLLESSGFKQLDLAAVKTLLALKIDKKVPQIEKLLSRKYSFIFDFEITKPT